MTKTSAADIREALLDRWPLSQYLHIPEAPQDAGRQGRKIDVLVLGLWQSRGLELDAVEIKVSMADWQRELANHEKADWWWQHSHRFWVAVPKELTSKVKEDLPSSWGLISVSGSGCKTVVNAPAHKPEPLPWTTMLGIIRTASGAGANALMRAERQGRERGWKEGQASAARRTTDKDYKDLLGRVAAFEEASGIKISGTYSPQDASQLGQLVALVNTWQRDPRRLTELVQSQHTRVVSLVEELGGVIGELAAAMDAGMENGA